MIAENWASVWEHVDDLRRTFLQSLTIVGIGFIFLLGCYQPILKLLTTYSLEPSESGLIKQKIRRIQVVNQTLHDQLFLLPLNASVVSDLIPSQKDGRHYYRLIPQDVLIYEETVQSPLLIMGPIEGITLVFRACLWLSLTLTAPFWGWIWLRFILPGLKSSERLLLVPFLVGSVICLSLGVLFAYGVTLPLTNQYLLLFNSSIGENAWTLTHYVNYVLLLCLGHAIAAELGLLLLLLVHFHFLSPAQLISKRRYMIILAFFLGALLTPPDVLTQLLLALPLIGLYEISIWYAKWRHYVL